ncbi:MAG: OmpH family outer membrane protein, partial [Kiritimatiellales bacterium]|nr:OmpH family outer membrane protein [Kiritimatiellales bacterium]
VFNEFYKTQLAKSKVQMQQADIDAERQLMVDEMTQISEEVDVLKKEARDVTLTQEIRDGKRLLYEERVLELRGKQKEIEEFSERRQRQVQMQVSRMSKTVMDEIREAIVEYAKQEGLLAVIDSSTRRAAVGVFIYTHADVDITEAVLAMLNSRRPDVLDGGNDLFDGEEVIDITGEEAPEKE